MFFRDIMVDLYRGGVPEWSIGADCKSAARSGYVGSNPTPSILSKYNGAHIAQQVEHVLGKNGVTSSNLVVGFDR
jgi:hypothetical protein